MSDYLTSFFGLFLASENQLWLMFVSGFLSATLLPGNSEIVFSTFASQLSLSGKKSELIWLWVVATLGNSLGSFTTYLMALLMPKPDLAKKSTKSGAWASKMIEKYGVFSLFFSWLPVIGDLLCGIAGWLRLNIWQSLIFMMLGKACRYGIMLWGIHSLFG